MENLVLLKLTCATCENADCKEGPQWTPIDSLNGCYRKVPEEIRDQYIHYFEEVIPFWHLYDIKYIDKSYFEIYNFLQKLYQNYPIINLIDNKGKVIGG